MVIRRIRLALMATLAATGMTLAAAGPASAYTVGPPGSAAEATSNAGFQMCGTAYEGDWVDDYPLPSGAAAVEETEFNGTLYASNGSVVADRTVLSGPDGTWCITGNPVWVPVITGGGWVVIESVDGGDMDGNGSSSRTIDVNLFDSKRVGGILGTSALPFNTAF